MVREKGLEPSRLWLDTGTSSLPVYLFQHSRISKCESYYNRIFPFVNRYFYGIEADGIETLVFSPAAC